MTIHRRHLRYSEYSQLRHSKKFIDFLTTEAGRLAGTGTGSAITFDNLTERVTQTTHGYTSGDGPFLLANSGGALPAELSTTTDYWVNVVDVNTYTLHLTEADAIAGTNVVAFTDNGTGTHTSLVGAEALDIFNAMLGGKSADEIRGISNIDNL